MKDQHRTKVLFVIPANFGGQILAIFPEQNESDPFQGLFINSYQHIGQHSPCHKSFLNELEASRDQYNELYNELEDIGYDLKVLNSDFVPSKEEITDNMNLYNNDEVGLNNPINFEESEYQLLLSDKYI